MPLIRSDLVSAKKQQYFITLMPGLLRKILLFRLKSNNSTIAIIIVNMPNTIAYLLTIEKNIEMSSKSLF